jgi:hypothetical protein
LAEKGLPDKQSNEADEGTFAHEVGQHALRHALNLDVIDQLLGREVPDDMKKHVQNYVDGVRSMTEGATFIDYEVKVQLDDVLKVPDEWGTSDVVALVGNELHIHDLKYGKGVPVYAEDNSQLKIYALGALSLVELFGEVETIRLVIHQPRIHGVDEWTISLADLLKWQGQLQFRVEYARNLLTGRIEPKDEDYVPGEKQCRFCKARGGCKKLQDYVMRTVADDFEDLDETKIKSEMASKEGIQFSKALEALPLIQIWVSEAKAAALRYAKSGGVIPGFKMVIGKAGPRKWTNLDEVMEVMKSTRLKKEIMWKMTLQTPTQIEKALKNNPKKWERFEPYITRTEPSPTVVVNSDKRPVYVPVADNDEFENLEGDNDGN